MRPLTSPSTSQEPSPLQPLLQEQPWGASFALAVGVHVLVFLLVFFSPYLFNQRRKIPEVYTVNLYTVRDVGAARLTAPSPTKVTAAPPEVKKVEEKAPPKPVKVPPVPPTPVPAAAAPPPKAISTQPLPVKSKADLERLKKLKESLNSEEHAKEAEKVAQQRTNEAVEALRRSLQAQSTPAKPSSAPPQAAVGAAQKGSATGAATGPNGSVMVDELLRRYLLAVNTQVQQHWKLPESQTWKNNLEAIIVIRVRRDGTLIDTFFEHRSESLTFNQYVERAVKDAAPLPPFPAALDQKDMEIGLRFRPGRVF